MTVRKTPKPVGPDNLNARPVVEVASVPRSFEVNLGKVLTDITEQIQERVNEGDTEPDATYAEYVLYGADFITEVS